MRKTLFLALSASAVIASAASVQAMPAPAATAAPPAAATTEKYTVEDTDLGTLLDNPATKAILTKHLPDEVLAKINADLVAVPVKR